MILLNFVDCGVFDGCGLWFTLLLLECGVDFYAYPLIVCGCVVFDLH